MIESLPLLAWPPVGQPLTILIFHRVLAVEDDLRPGEPAAEEFARLMGYLARYFTVLPLREAVMRMRQGCLPKRACCLTFDDGYADNLTIALPILESHQLPATVFIATGYLDGGRMFNDVVIDAVAQVADPVLDLRAMGLGMHQLATPADRRATIATILEQLKYRPPEQREADVMKLLELADCGPLPDNIMLTTVQVGELSRRGVEIGGHTVSHPILTSLADEKARQEMATGKLQLESIIGKPVTSFAYPNGRPHRDYAERHVAMAKDLGFELAVSTAHGVGKRNGDVFQLPRFTPWRSSMTMLGARMMRNAWTGKAAAAC